MKRIRHLWVGILALVVLGQGEYTIYLGDDVPNLILVSFRGNERHPLPCSNISIPDIFPDDIVQHGETFDADGTSRSATHDEWEPVVITLYDSIHDKLCDQKRQRIALPDNYDRAIRLIQISYGCVSQESTVRFHDEAWHGDHGTIELVGQGKPENNLRAIVHSLYWSDQHRGSSYGGVSISMDGGMVDVSSVFSLPTSERRLLRVKSASRILLPAFDNGESENAFGTFLTSIGEDDSSLNDVAQSRTTGQEICLAALDECCSDQDCPPNNICTNRHCIDEGYPRFTLSWQGDDDIDLHVVTPSGFVLSYRSVLDPKTGGKVGEPVEQSAPGYHVENVYFPIEGTAPNGVYEYYIRPMTTVGTADEWMVKVFDERGEVARHTGTRFSPRYRYSREKSTSPSSTLPLPIAAPSHSPTLHASRKPMQVKPSSKPVADPSPSPLRSQPSRQPGVDQRPRPTLSPLSRRPIDDLSPAPLTPVVGAPGQAALSPTSLDHVNDSTPRPMMSPTMMSQSPSLTNTLALDDKILSRTTLPCTPFIDECCNDSDCLFNGEVCLNRNCVDEGSPRISLSWIGDDDLDLFVLTPSGAELSFNNLFDPISGGRFGEGVDQFGTGYHVENVFFPMTGAPFGRYEFFVRPLTTFNEADEWSLTVFDEGQMQVNEVGVGLSLRFSWLREMPEPSPPVTSPRPMVPPISRPSTNTPQTVPSRPPSVDPDCNEFSDECCKNTDCLSARDVCEQRTCIRDGNPRFTLRWDGVENFDLYVLTPDGVEISENKPFDFVSGGRFELDPSDGMVGKHVENVYFPVLGAPIGQFRYGVRSTGSVTGSTTWTVEVHDEKRLIDSHVGQGGSQEFQYVRLESPEGPQRPRPSPPRCSLESDECCLDSDCDSGDICAQRTCIANEYLRFSLEWTGDDDLNFFVETPSGVVLSERNKTDQVTGGRHQSDAPQIDFGFHVESVYFPKQGANAGSYNFKVESAVTRGVGADVWKVGVFEKGEQIQEYSGIGESRQFSYNRLDGAQPPTTPSPVTSPTSVPACTTPKDECCSDSHCGSEKICVKRHCIGAGSPRVTLSWIGDDDLDLYLKTPLGDVIFFDSTFDPTTGGRFDTEYIQKSYGFHVENIFFPAISSPLGTYTAGVRLASRRGSADIWTLEILDGGRRQLLETGSGDSEFYSYARKMAVSPTAPAAPIPRPTVNAPAVSPISERPPQGPTSSLPPVDRYCPHECCSDGDCGMPGELCVQRTCIKEGTPRFTLTWTGNDDLNLAVITPAGNTISYKNPNDSQSGGILSDGGNQKEFGFHVENIAFPSRGGPEGEYRFFVKSGTARGDSDRWALRVFVDGKLAAWKTGKGSSRTFAYDYLPAGEMPTMQPVRPPDTISPVATRPPIPVPTQEFCQDDSECQGKGEICVQETCINDGNPRFTLLWTGNDDLEIYVETPDGSIISRLNPYDGMSGGFFGENGEQEGFDRHVENIYFPLGPSGTYTYYVRSPNLNGSDDFWQVSVSINGQVKAAQSGSGDSARFAFIFDGGMGPIVPTQAPITPECVSKSDCSSNEVCANENCVDGGNPRVTLTWTGDDDLDLFVETPLGVTISFQNPEDKLSTGRFGAGGGEQTTFGKHAENIFFQGDAPNGVYRFFVESHNQRGSEDLWNVRVFSNGQVLRSKSGLGNSDVFSFQFAGAPVSSPTQSPGGGVCDSTAECCTDQDCLGDEVCTQNLCIDVGEPRFTLTWTGDDDLDLIVKTPNGTFISFLNNFDPGSGGRFGDGGDQFEFGAHVENVFFLKSDSPVGLYSYFVQSFLSLGQDDTWTVTVFVQDQVVAQESGTGNSEELQYEYMGFLPTLTSVPAVMPPSDVIPEAPEECSITVEECCTDLQCMTGVEVCVQTQCIELGNPRFTLTWNGDDDLDLKVETPLGTKLSFIQPIDESTGGIFGEEGSQFTSDKNVENVYFQEDKAPSGIYKYSVTGFVNRASNDRWTVTVYVDNQEVASETGFGDSIEFSYRYLGAGSSSQGDGPPQLLDCQPDVDDCCGDSDCSGNDELCVQRTCINRGNPRFTLTWTGDDDLDLTVVTPLGSTVAVGSTTDPLSGGVFGEEGDQLAFGAHVENIYFPEGGGPIGTYTFFVASFDEIGKPDQWTVTVYVMDSPVFTKSGNGTSDFLVFDYFDGSSATPSELNPVVSRSANRQGTEPTPGISLGCDLEQDKCCQDSDCGAFPNTLCVQRMCIDEGSPRFTLTWNGNDDYDLLVTPPIGDTLSMEHAVDFESGGRFGEGGLQPRPGLHVENIFFPDGPIGTYTIRVQPYQIIDFADTWTMRAYVGGVETASFSGKGDAQDFTFDYRMSRQQPSIQVDECSTKTSECCKHDDCTRTNDLCLRRSCVDVAPNETTVVLSWLGDDDWDLKVTASSGKEVSYYSPRDDVSGARFLQSNRGMAHYESVILPRKTGAAAGLRFQWQVAAFNTIGDPDAWHLDIFTGREKVFFVSGHNDSDVNAFEVPPAGDVDNGGGNQQGAGAIMRTVEPPKSNMSLSSDVKEPAPEGSSSSSPGDTKSTGRCVEALDCALSTTAVCLASHCLAAGALRVSLQWHHGDADEWTVSVWTPDLQTFASDSADWQKVDETTMHLRSWSVPGASLVDGKYLVSVRHNNKTDTTAGGSSTDPKNHDWTLRIHRHGKQVFHHRGDASGTSFFDYDYES